MKDRFHKRTHERIVDEAACQLLLDKPMLSSYFLKGPATPSLTVSPKTAADPAVYRHEILSNQNEREVMDCVFGAGVSVGSQANAFGRWRR